MVVVATCGDEKVTTAFLSDDGDEAAEPEEVVVVSAAIFTKTK